MYLNFVNKSSYAIVLNIDDGASILLRPYEKRRIAKNDSERVKILARPNEGNTTKSGTGCYRLVLETEYIFSCIMDDTTFVLVRENIEGLFELTYDVAYKRISISSDNAKKETEKHKVFSADRVKEMHRKKKRRDYIFESILSTFELIVLLIIIGLVIKLAVGWKATLIYIPFAIVVWIVFNWLSFKISGKLVKTVFKNAKELEFDRFLEDDIIKESIEEHLHRRNQRTEGE